MIGAVGLREASRLVAAMILLALVLSLLTFTKALGQSSERVPPMQGRVTDLAFALAKSDDDALASLLKEFELETHHQIAVLIVPALNGESLESFSLRVANAWGVGLKGWNDGILVTVAVREQGVRIEIGEGMERYISNSMAEDIIDKDMIPAFQRGDVAGALHAGLLHLMLEARPYKIPDPHHLPTHAPHSEATSEWVARTVSYCARLAGSWHYNDSSEIQIELALA
jgi:uncharacterized membrane protein YgcG